MKRICKTSRYSDEDIILEEIDDSDENMVNYKFVSKDKESSIGAYIYHDDPTSIYLNSLFVSKHYRQKGRGNNLLKFVEQFGRENGCTHCYLWAKSDSWMVDWYSRRGYRFHSKRDDDHVWMVKEL
jgi:N-acetylglutamate synthase-like GNAT family acetyltransferase